LSRDEQHATFSDVKNQAAYLLRENTGTSGVLETARTAVAALADHNIPHLIVGGIAVQEHGYPRATIVRRDSAAHSPLRRLRDKTDVVELILRRKLPRNLTVAPAVRPLYRETWDGLQAEA
jgi:hypothetical protein